MPRGGEPRRHPPRTTFEGESPVERTLNLIGMLPWFAWVAIVAIVSGSVSGLLSAWMKHRERMAMIQHGMNPDAADAAEAKAHVPEL